MVRELADLIGNIPLFLAWLQETASPWLVTRFGIDPFDVNLDNIANGVMGNWQKTGGIVGAVLARMTQSGFAFLGALGVVGLTPVVAFYMMRDWDLIMARILDMVPRDVEPSFIRLCKECDEVLGAFLRGQLLIMFLLGVVYAIGLYAVGLDLAILIGMLAGLASIVPYLGFFVGIVAASIAAMFQFQDPVYLGYVGIVFLIGQALEGWVLTPWLVGDKIGLHPVAVIFAVLAGGQLFGFVGILLALPLAAVVMVFVRYLHKSYLGSEYYDTGDQKVDGGERVTQQLALKFRLDDHTRLDDYVGEAGSKLVHLSGLFICLVQRAQENHTCCKASAIELRQKGIVPYT